MSPDGVTPPPSDVTPLSPNANGEWRALCDVTSSVRQEPNQRVLSLMCVKVCFFLHPKSRACSILRRSILTSRDCFAAARVQKWLQLNRFTNYVKVFQNFSGESRDADVIVGGIVTWVFRGG